MRLVLIKPGTFTMGSPDDEKDRFGNEGPQHEVEISKAFYMGACPVTVGQFRAFVKDDDDYQTEAEGAGDVRTWRYPGFGPEDDDPVVEVTWNDAVKFCKWLSWKEKQTYELPTEAQWEYACRAGTKTAYFFGDDDSDLDAYAWYGGNSGNRTHPVGKKKPNGWGLYDMSGNVWQWCADSYDGKYYNNSPNKDPRNMLNTGTRVVRGGSWLGGASYWRGGSLQPRPGGTRRQLRLSGLRPGNLLGQGRKGYRGEHAPGRQGGKAADRLRRLRGPGLRRLEGHGPGVRRRPRVWHIAPPVAGVRLRGQGAGQ